MIERLEDKCKELIDNRKYDECEREIAKAMMQMPHSAMPHNLMGILCGKKQDYILAMKHFRAAYGLDPTYIPSRYNMDQFGRPHIPVKYAYTEEDCVVKKDSQFSMIYDENNIGHLRRK